MIRPKYETPQGVKRKQPRHVPAATLTALTARDGRVCAWCGRESETLVPQHRQGGAGGRANKHRLSNLVWLCSLTNGALESDAEMQSEALMRGIKVSIHDDPLEIPVRHALHGLRFIDDAGNARREDENDG